MKRCVLEHTVKMREVTCLGKLRLYSLFNILQDIAVEHADILHLGFNDCFKKGVSWVGAGYRLQINRLPKLGEKVKLETWISTVNAASSAREYKATDVNGGVLFRGTTQWVLISLDTLRPAQLTKHLPIDLALIDGEAMSEEPFPRLKPAEKTEFETSFIARFDEMDVNGHINNAVYPMWAVEAVPEEWKYEKEPVFVKINYKRPVKSGQKVTVRTHFDDNKTTHTISSEEGVAVLLEIEWKNAKEE